MRNTPHVPPLPSAHRSHLLEPLPHAGASSTASSRHYRFFPGWTMLGISATAMFMSGPGQSYSVAAFKDPMRESLQVSETGYSVAYAIATLVSGMLLPWIGRLLDRRGARLLLPLIGTVLAGACVWMSLSDSLLDLFLGFSLVRALGQGALSLISVWIVSEWFERRRGFATALAGLGGSLSVMTFPILNRHLIEAMGWPFVWQVHAVLIFGSLVLPSLLLLRDRPEDLGLHPDGDEPAAGSSHASSAVAETLGDDTESGGELKVQAVASQAAEGKAASNGHAVRPASGGEDAVESEQDRPLEMPPPLADSWSLGEVLRDSTFWKLLAVPTASGMIGTGLVFHQAALLGSRGVSREFALDLIAWQAVVATFAALLAGWLTDRLPARYILATAMVLLAGAALWVQFLPLPTLAVVYAIAMGLHGSILRSAGTVVWVNYYGRAQQGRIRGVAMSVMILAAAIGPLPLALSIDLCDNYDPAMWLFITLPLAAGLCVWTAKPPIHPRQRELQPTSPVMS